MYYFFEEDLRELEIKLKKLHQSLKDIESELIQIGARRDAGLETNSTYNILLVIYKTTNKQLDELSQIRNRGTLSWIVAPGKKEGVTIGNTVVVHNLTDDKKITLDIRSYWIPHNGNNRVAYSAPLPELIMGAKVGETREGFIGGVLKNYKIQEIK